MNSFFAMIAYATPPATPPATGNPTAQLMSTFLPLILMVVVFYFLLIRPQRKKDKAFKEMLSGLQAGDNVVSIGGIAGKVLSIKEDDVTVETGADKTKISFKKWAIKEVLKIEA